MPGNGGNGNGRARTLPRTRSQWLIEGTNQVWNGLVLNYAGRVFSTQTGAYEGIFSRPLTAAPQPQSRRTPLPNGGQARNIGNGGIVIDDPGLNDQQQNQGGGGY